ncbi:hypothetical protein QCE63_30120 [Caballeronia sp. LZ065]|nr:hypothetical protein [Caballeronia sp. LZ065]MDR5783675.1 hypothetical protein [Caballeronia sp. LZ065]
MDSLLVVIVVGVASLVFYGVLLGWIWSLRPPRECDADPSVKHQQ